MIFEYLQEIKKKKKKKKDICTFYLAKLIVLDVNLIFCSRNDVNSQQKLIYQHIDERTHSKFTT